MKTVAVIEALSALAHEHRLAVYRLLVEQGPEGLAAGVIGERVGLVPSSLTFHLQNLQRAGLITQRRESRQLIYSADFTDSMITGRVVDPNSGVLNNLRVTSSFPVPGPATWCLVDGRTS